MRQRIKTARFPVVKALAEFDFDFQPQLDVKPIETLATCGFIEKKGNGTPAGQPGTGKSHLAIAPGMKACGAGYSVRFTTIQDLAAGLRAAMADQSVEDRIAEFVEPDGFWGTPVCTRRGPRPRPALLPRPARGGRCCLPQC